MTVSATNRRRFFRIDDRVCLSYRRREPEEGLSPALGDHVVHPAAEQLYQLDLELNTLLNTLWQDQPVAAEAIGLINRKIQILSAEVDLDTAAADHGESREIDVNISGCGVAFNCAEEFAPGDLLELQITLLPSHTALHMLSRVSGFDRNHNGIPMPHRVRVDFIGTDSPAHEKLIQHLVQRQSAQIAAQRETAEFAGED
jgi:hypothetical protein